MIFSFIPATEDASEDLGMQCLDPPVHYFGKARVLSHIDDRKACLFEVFPSASGAVEFKAQGGQAMSQFADTRFVADAQQGSAGRWGGGGS